MLKRIVTTEQLLNALIADLQPRHPQDFADTWNALYFETIKPVTHRSEWVGKDEYELTVDDPGRYCVIHYQMYGTEYRTKATPEHEHQRYVEQLRESFGNNLGSFLRSITWIEWLTDDEVERLPVAAYLNR